MERSFLGQYSPELRTLSQCRTGGIGIVDNRASALAQQKMVNQLRSATKGESVLQRNKILTGVIQEKSLEQAGGAVGLMTAGEGDILAVGADAVSRTGKVYKKEEEVGGGKVDMLKRAAEICGDVGGRYAGKEFITGSAVNAKVKDWVDLNFNNLNIPQGTPKKDHPALLQQFLNNLDFSIFIPEHLMGGKENIYKINKHGKVTRNYPQHLSERVANGEFQELSTLDLLDPFLLDVSISKRPEEELPEEEQVVSHIDLRYQHAPNFRGYVMKVKEEGFGNNFDARLENRSVLPETNQEVGLPDGYSRSHDISDGGKFADKLGVDPTKTKRENEQHLDAYAVLAGEGARWQIVRDHAGDLNKGTFFYIPKPGGEGCVGVTFETLWCSWKNVFLNEFNILNEKLKEKLSDNQTPWQGAGRQEKSLENIDGNCIEVV